MYISLLFDEFKQKL